MPPQNSQPIFEVVRNRFIFVGPPRITHIPHHDILAFHNILLPQIHLGNMYQSHVV